MALSGKTKFTLITALVMGAFLAGYIPSCARVRSLKSELRSSEDRLRRLSMQSELGKAIIEVQQNNFGNAKESITAFFDLIRDSLPEMPEGSARTQLSAVLNRRDEIISDLTSLRPEVLDKLRAIYRDLIASMKQN
jgi:CRISPR/Cas system-associated protein Cas10 (large subunit of type III CRISPR-Cas system)